MFFDLKRAISLFKRLFGFMVLKCVWNNVEVAAFVGSVSFRKTTLTGMCYEFPAFAGMTTLLGEMGEIPAFAGIGSDHSSFPKYIKTKNE
ncbi:MAG: hypothetical protein WC220_06400 [Pedobacter sp.]